MKKNLKLPMGRTMIAKTGKCSKMGPVRVLMGIKDTKNCSYMNKKL